MNISGQQLGVHPGRVMRDRDSSGILASDREDPYDLGRPQACRRGLDEAVSPKDVGKAVQEAATEVSWPAPGQQMAILHPGPGRPGVPVR